MSPEPDNTFDHEILTSTGQYENVKTHFHGSPEDAVALSQKMRRLAQEGEGISSHDLNYVLDCMLKGEGVKNGIDYWEKMTGSQKLVVNELKKALKRQAYKSKE